jgi:hypothetical protein
MRHGNFCDSAFKAKPREGQKSLASEACKIEFIEAFQSDLPCPSPAHLCDISDFQKLSLTPDPNQLLILAIPSRERGRWPSSLTLGRGAVDADALLTNSA